MYEDEQNFSSEELSSEVDSENTSEDEETSSEVSSESTSDELSSEVSSEVSSELSSEQTSETYATVVYDLDEGVKQDIHVSTMLLAGTFLVCGTAFFIWLIGVVLKELNRFF